MARMGEGRGVCGGMREKRVFTFCSESCKFCTKAIQTCYSFKKLLIIESQSLREVVFRALRKRVLNLLQHLERRCNKKRYGHVRLFGGQEEMRQRHVAKWLL